MLSFLQAFISKKQRAIKVPFHVVSPHSYSPTELEVRIAQEHLRQARCSFNLSLAMVTAGTIVSLVGAGLLLSGKTTEGAVTAAGSAVSSIFHVQLMKDANDRLEKSAAIVKEQK